MEKKDENLINLKWASKNYWLFVGALVISTSILVGGGVFWWQQKIIIKEVQKENQEIQQSLREQIKQLNNQINEQKKKQEEKEARELKHWSVCRNKRHGYEIQFPGSWNIYVGLYRQLVYDCEGTDSFYLSPNINVDKQDLQFIDVDTYDMGEPEFEGETALTKYFNSHPKILQNNPIVKESLLHGERVMWLKDVPTPWIYFSHDKTLYEIKGKGISSKVFESFLLKFRFLD